MDYLIYNLADSHLQPLADAALLSESERATANRRGNRYLLTRCLLRRELAHRLTCAPQDIRFCYGGNGKPAIEGSPLHFNLSHSGDCFAIAFDRNPIGIDVERIRSRARIEALAARIMCAEQLTAFCERQCPLEEFFACWCAAEALVKQSGNSIWQARKQAFHYEHGCIRLSEDSALTVQLFSPMPGFMGAVAYT